MKSLFSMVTYWLGRLAPSASAEPTSPEPDAKAPPALQLTPDPVQDDLFDTPTADTEHGGAEPRD